MSRLTDDVLDDYDYATDAALEGLRSLDRASLRSMIAYGRGVNNFGRQMTAHQNRVAKDGALFLRHLGFSARAAQNFRAALLFHDIGKMHASYEPTLWGREDRPNAADKALQRQHARRGAEMFDAAAASLPGLADHPHFAIRRAVTLYHHERIDAAGPEGVTITTLPVFVQASCIIDAYDGDRIKRPHQDHRRTPREALDRLMNSEKYHGAFDKSLLARYVEMKERS